MKRHAFVPWIVICSLLGAGASGALAAPAGGGLEEFLASTTESGWSEVTIDTTRDVGTYLDVAVLPGTGTPYVSYYDKSGADLWFARFVGFGGNCGPGNSWSCQLVGSTGDVGKYNSIAVRKSGPTIQVIITYLTGSSLGYAWGECLAGGCSFTPYLIQTGTTNVVTRGLYTSVEFAFSGYPYVAYHTLTNTNSGYAMIATRTTGGGNCGVGAVAGYWQCDTILNATGLGSYTSVALNAAGALNVAFYDSINGRPYLATRVGSGGNCGPSSSWYCRSPFINTHDTGRSISAFVESDGTPHVAYVDATTQEMVYASFVGSNGNCGFSGVSTQFEWQCDVIDDDIGSVGTGRTVAITGDADGEPMIAYRDASSMVAPPVLMFAQPYHAAPAGAVPNCGPISMIHTWSCSMLDNAGTYQEEAAAVAIASNADGLAVAYHELDTYAMPEEGNLKVNMQLSPFFADGFESGNLSAWSSTVP
jgi:hypothetical protein